MNSHGADHTPKVRHTHAKPNGQSLRLSGSFTMNEHSSHIRKWRGTLLKAS